MNCNTHEHTRTHTHEHEHTHTHTPGALSRLPRRNSGTLPQMVRSRTARAFSDLRHTCLPPNRNGQLCRFAIDYQWEANSESLKSKHIVVDTKSETSDTPSTQDFKRCNEALKKATPSFLRAKHCETRGGATIHEVSGK